LRLCGENSFGFFVSEIFQYVCQPHQEDTEPSHRNEIYPLKEEPGNKYGKRRPQNDPYDKYMKSVHKNIVQNKDSVPSIMYRFTLKAKAKPRLPIFQVQRFTKITS